MKGLVFIVLAACAAGCDDADPGRFSNIPACQNSQVRECNRPDGNRGQQVCGPLGYWTTSCDARDASNDVVEVPDVIEFVDVGTTPTDAGATPPVD